MKAVISVKQTENSLFGDKTYKRLEITISPPDSLFPLTQLDRIIEENFPSVPRDKISMGFCPVKSVRNDGPTFVLMKTKR